MKLGFCVSYNYTQRDLFLPPSTTTPQQQPPSPQQQPPAAAAAAAATTTNNRHQHHHQHQHHHHNRSEIPPKTRYKQKQNGIQYENSTHFIRLPLSKVETPPLQYYTTHPKTP